MRLCMVLTVEQAEEQTFTTNNILPDLNGYLLCVVVESEGIASTSQQ